jgi:hypothetical protein
VGVVVQKVQLGIDQRQIRMSEELKLVRLCFDADHPLCMVD